MFVPIPRVEGGYLFIVPPDNVANLERNVRRQRSVGCVVDLLTPQELKNKFPSMNVDDLGAGAHTPHDGWCDPNGLQPGEGGSPESLGRTPLDPRFRGEDAIWEHHSCAGTFRHS